MQIEPQSFIIGFILGMIYAGLLGRILRRIYIAWMIMGSPDRPMNVPTQGTPRHVMTVAAAALWVLIRWAVVLILVVAIGILALYVLIISSL